MVVDAAAHGGYQGHARHDGAQLLRLGVQVLVVEHEKDDRGERDHGNEDAKLGLHPVGHLVLLGGRVEVVRALPQLRADHHQHQVHHQEHDDPGRLRKAGQEQRPVRRQDGQDLRGDAQHPQHDGRDAERQALPLRSACISSRMACVA